MSQTGFSPESPTARLTRLLGITFLAEVRRQPTRWSHRERKIAIDCIKWLTAGIESLNSARDPYGVRFIHLSEQQNDALYTCYYEVLYDEPA